MGLRQILFALKKEKFPKSGSPAKDIFFGDFTMSLCTATIYVAPWFHGHLVNLKMRKEGNSCRKSPRFLLQLKIKRGDRRVQKAPYILTQSDFWTELKYRERTLFTPPPALQVRNHHLGINRIDSLKASFFVPISWTKCDILDFFSFHCYNVKCRKRKFNKTES